MKKGLLHFPVVPQRPFVPYNAMNDPYGGFYNQFKFPHFQVPSFPRALPPVMHHPRGIDAATQTLKPSNSDPNKKLRKMEPLIALDKRDMECVTALLEMSRGAPPVELRAPSPRLRPKRRRGKEIDEDFILEEADLLEDESAEEMEPEKVTPRKRARGYGGRSNTDFKSYDSELVTPSKKKRKKSNGGGKSKGKVVSAESKKAMLVRLESPNRKKKPKKKNSHMLPERSREILMDWFKVNLDCPYPSADEKETLMKRARLTKTQISNWFTNMRKRVWAPCIEESKSRQKVKEESCEEFVRPRRRRRCRT